MTIADLSFVTDVLAKIDELAEQAGWDGPAKLYALHAERLEADVTMVGVADFPGFDLAYDLTGHPHHAMTMLRHILDGTAGHVPDLLAIALTTEAWMVKVEPGSPPPTGDFGQAPGAVEQRFVLLVGVDGSTRSLIRYRDTGEIRQDAGLDQGRILDGMRALIHAATGPVEETSS